MSMRDFVTDHPLFCSHTHHFDFRDFDQQRASFDFRSLLGYAHSDLMTTAGARWADWTDDEVGVAAMWPKIRTTGYGRAVALMSQDLFGLEYCPDNFSRITQALRNLIGDRSPAEIYDELLQQKANTKWVVKDWHASSGVVPSGETVYPEYYRFSWRMDGLFSIAGCGIIDDLESDTGLSILTIDHLVEAMNASISAFRAEAPFAGLKVGMAYQRDLSVADPARHEAELAFNRIRNRKLFHRGVQQEHGAVSLLEGRPLGDYLFHGLMRRAHDEGIPVQVHTGYLARHWGSLTSTKASHLIPIFDKYRRVKFDIFHGSWPWMSELGAIAKNYPNVYPDLCWAWTMNPAECERGLSEWLDAVPFNKILGYGSDTGYPWCDVGYAKQARIGIARVLEQKVDAGYFSPATAEEVASAIMLVNGEELFGLR